MTGNQWWGISGGHVVTLGLCADRHQAQAKASAAGHQGAEVLDRAGLESLVQQASASLNEAPPSSVLTAREVVIAVATGAWVARPTKEFEVVAEKALRAHYCLGPRDGIWGGSDAAVEMGYRGRSEDEDLLSEIARGLVPEIDQSVAKHYLETDFGASDGHPGFSGWTVADAARAHQEGWDVFDCGNEVNGRWQIQRLDASDVPGAPQLADENAAWRLIVQGCLLDSAHHRAALDFVRQHNLIEYEAILSFSEAVGTPLHEVSEQRASAPSMSVRPAG